MQPDKYDVSIDSLKVTVFDILEKLKSYTDNRCILSVTAVDYPSSSQLEAEIILRLNDLKFLQNNDIIEASIMNRSYADGSSGYFINVVNRYNLEKLLREIDSDAKQAPLENLVYYNQRTGASIARGTISIESLDGWLSNLHPIDPKLQRRLRNFGIKKGLDSMQTVAPPLHSTARPSSLYYRHSSPDLLESRCFAYN